MFPLSSFFEKFRLLAQGEAKRKEITLAILKEYTTLAFEEKQISFRDGALFVETRPGEKQKIFIHKTQILSALEASLGKGKVNDIR